MCNGFRCILKGFSSNILRTWSWLAKQLSYCEWFYLLTPWSRVLLEKLSSFQLVKKFLSFFGTWRFIATFTSACHLSLSWASLIQSMPQHTTAWRSILILSSHLHLGLPGSFFPSGFPTKTLYTPLLSHINATCPDHLILLDLVAQTILGEEYRLLSSPLCSLFPLPCYLIPWAQTFSSTLYSQTPSTYIPPSMSATKFHTHTKPQAKLFCVYLTP